VKTSHLQRQLRQAEHHIGPWWHHLTTGHTGQTMFGIAVVALFLIYLSSRNRP
jgi:hypothetical protein